MVAGSPVGINNKTTLKLSSGLLIKLHKTILTHKVRSQSNIKHKFKCKCIVLKETKATFVLLVVIL